jgi:plasmid stability protein
MATFLVRLDDSELEALREAAEAQGRSMNDLAREGLRAVTSGGAREEKIRALTRRVMSEQAGLLKRLGEA